MSAKKRTESSESVTVESGNPFEADMSLGNPEFSLETLLEECKAKMAENDKRKISYSDRISKAKENIRRIGVMIEGLELKSASESGQAWMNSLIQPIMVELQSIFPNASVEKSSVMTGAITLTLCKKGTTPAGKLKGVDCRSVTFCPREDGLGIRDYSENTQEYPEGSIGAISGLNHPVVAVPSSKAIQFIVDWIMK